MKKQIQTIFLLFFLTGCMVAPLSSFEEDFKSSHHYQTPFDTISFISQRKYFDSAHHLEDKISHRPEQVIRNWIHQHLKTDHSESESLQIILHQAEIIRELKPAKNWWQPDYIQDTLNYKIELKDNKDHSLNVAGKAYVQMGKRISLSDKEKQWAKLYQTMLNHLENEILKLPHVVQSN